jgi:hypothetical protein
MNIRITGALIADPENRTTLSGEASVIFTIDGGRGWPIEARVKLGTDFRTAERLAHSCKRGDAIEVEASGCSPRTDHSVAAILLLEVARVNVGGFVVPGLLR